MLESNWGIPLLPFLQKKRQDTGLIIQERQPDTEEKDNDSDELEEIAKDLISAIERKDHRAVADALHAAFTVADSEPHEEGEHVSPHSYDAQNED